MGRNITLVGKRLCWSDALLYCRDFHWDLLSIRGPEEQEIIDEMVSRANFPLTSHLWVGLRRSIFGTSWFWMSGDPMDFTQWEHGSHQSSPCGSMAMVCLEDFRCEVCWDSEEQRPLVEESMVVSVMAVCRDPKSGIVALTANLVYTPRRPH
ncbi:hypothetical protein NHX12_014843, partial [Muraenolepis orangiensis]